MNSVKDEFRYTYHFADGTTCTVKFGEEGVRRKDILRLQELDHKEYTQECKLLKNTDYKFLDALKRYERYPGELQDSPFERIPDEKADIWNILYGEKDEWKNLETLQKAMKQ